MQFRMIGVAPSEYELLNQAKSQYEADTGHKTKWGTFLALLATGFLIGTGIAVAKSLRDKEREEALPKERSRGKTER